jgi:ribosomal protein S27E
MDELTRPNDEFLYVRCENPLLCLEDMAVLPRNSFREPRPGYGPVLDVRCPRCGHRFLIHVRHLREYQGFEGPNFEPER